MWHLRKPTLKSAKDDLENVVSTCNSINNDDKSAFEDLYEEYDSHNGSISVDYHTDFMSKFPMQAAAMKGQYKKTFEGERLYYIRDELTRDVYKCPYCGFGEPVTLDHYLPESIFSELATCRLNLVPLCWKCNNEKRNKDYHNFIHSYYQEFDKDVIFFKCKIEARNGGILVFDYYIDGSNIDGGLKQILDSQISCIKLNERLNKQSVLFILDNFGIGYENDNALRYFIEDRLSKVIEKRGKNDWQAALLDGLLNCHEFDMSFLKNYISRNKNIQGI